MDILAALEHHRAGRLLEAVQIYQQLLQEQPDNPDALHLMGNAACQLGDAALSIALISKAQQLAPTNTVYLLSLGMAYRANTQYAESLACYDAVLKMEPRSASAYFGIANTQQNQGRFDDARANFSIAIELNPELFEAQYNLANLEKSLGNFALAVQHYQAAIALKPDMADAYHNMGAALYAQGKRDEALESYRQALWKNLPETHNNIGNVFYDQGQFEAALLSYRHAIEARQDYAEAYNNVGNALRKLGKTKESAIAFGEAIRLNPGYAIAHLNLGDLLLGTNELESAAAEYESAIVSAPDLLDAYFNLGVVRNRLHDFAAAQRNFEQALRLRPNHIDALYNLGVVHGRLLNPGEAERCYRGVLTLDPEHIAAHINLSAILMDDGRREEAGIHMDFAYSRKNVFAKYSATAKKTVLILFDAGKGNLNLTYLFNEKTTNIIDWMIAYASEEQVANLPHYDVVFNAMGDPDLTRGTVEPVNHFISTCKKPVLNHPALVTRTARDKLPELLQGINHLLVPQVWRFSDDKEWDEALQHQLPLLIRPIYSHGGVGLELATTAEELAHFKATQNSPVYVSRYIDYRSADSWFRKYRMIFIDRKPYPYHLAISQNWIVHYYNADMKSHSWKLEEEKRYLQHPEQVLGADGMRAVEMIGEKMDLDYAGIDFTILSDGRILVFEANPTMLAHPEDPDGPLAHKNIHVQRIFDAFENLLNQSATNNKTH